MGAAQSVKGRHYMGDAVWPTRTLVEVRCLEPRADFWPELLPEAVVGGEHRRRCAQPGGEGATVVWYIEHTRQGTAYRGRTWRAERGMIDWWVRWT